MPCRRWLTSFLALVLLVGAGRDVLAACPATGGCSLTTSTAPRGSAECFPSPGTTRRYSWDIPQATACAVLVAGDDVSESQVRMADDYVIHLPGATGLVALDVGLHVSGHVSAGAAGSGSVRAATLHQGDEQPVWLTEVRAGESRNVAGFVGGGRFMVPVNQPFRLELWVTAFGRQVANDLCSNIVFYPPMGATITSCNGYFRAPGVPVRPTSWGRLKVHYR